MPNVPDPTVQAYDQRSVTTKGQKLKTGPMDNGSFEKMQGQTDGGNGGSGGPAPQSQSQPTKGKISINFKTDLDPELRKLSNKVRTTKYTVLTWIPLSLFYQFQRAANVYFLVITVLTTLPFSPKKPASMIGTFSMVLIFTMLKEAYEDYQRHKSDNELNNRATQKINY